MPNYSDMHLDLAQTRNLRHFLKFLELRKTSYLGVHSNRLETRSDLVLSRGNINREMDSTVGSVQDTDPNPALSEPPRDVPENATAFVENRYRYMS